MKISDLPSLGLSPQRIDALEIDHVQAVVNDEFMRRMPPDHPAPDYRKRAVERLARLKAPLHNEQNITYDVVKQFIRVTCPYCNATMLPADGSGSGDKSTVRYTCAHSCGASASVTFSHGDLSFLPPLLKPDKAKA